MRKELDQQLLLDFFLTFSRFEYALKHSGLYQQRPGARIPYEATPDWDSFAVRLRGTFDPSRATELREAVDLFLLHPPFREVVAAGGLGWDTTALPETLSEIECLLIYIRRVRNNLFHGGKFSEGQNFDAERNTKLLSASLVILYECLNQDANVKREYDAAIL
jgi:hypothetical protein